ncbi:MAG: nucleotidyltransferase family protein [Gammaproteobacteria bacterium]|nr:nucleotidyltransferase family protein [Gammaproteobacteria bacterium]
MPEITGLLLAAGNGSRFGGQKLLQSVWGKLLIEHSISSLSACDRVLAVIREADEDLQHLLQTAGVDWVVNPRAEQGMGGSLACGVTASRQSSAWCIVPADMPCISTVTMLRVVEALRHGASIVAPYYDGQRGHPVGFSKLFRDRLTALRGDTGARDLLSSEAKKLLKLEVNDPGILLDVDTTRDLHALEAAPAFSQSNL